jgi:hypothetical protein
VEDLTKDDFVQLLNFYKNKSVELEFSYLMLQINNKKVLDKKEKEYEKLLLIKDKTYNDLIKKEKDSNNETKMFLKKEIEKRDKQIQKYKKTDQKS